MEKQIADVETLLEMGCKAIALSSVDLEGLKSSVDLCLSKGVPVIECRGMDHESIITFNLCDETTMAEMAFSWYEELLDADPDLVLNMGLIYGLASQTAQLVRVDHLVELLEEKYGDRINVLASQPCDWDTQKAHGMYGKLAAALRRRDELCGGGGRHGSLRRSAGGHRLWRRSQ